jgi:hypothetical protein
MGVMGGPTGLARWAPQGQFKGLFRDRLAPSVIFFFLA